MMRKRTSSGISGQPKRARDDMIAFSDKSKLVIPRNTAKPPFNQDRADQFFLDLIDKPAENWTQQLIDSFDKHSLFCIQHFRGSNSADESSDSAGQRKVWIVCLGYSKLVLDQNGRDGRAKTLVSGFRPRRIFAWMWSKCTFFSVTGMVQNEPCFWVFTENATLNDEVCRKVFRSRSHAKNYTLGRWREMFPNQCSKIEPQTNEIFLDNYKSLIEFELGFLGASALSIAQNLQEELDLNTKLSETEKLKVIESFASMFILKVEEFQSLMTASRSSCGDQDESSVTSSVTPESTPSSAIDLLGNHGETTVDDSSLNVLVQEQLLAESDEIMIVEYGNVVVEAGSHPPSHAEEFPATRAKETLSYPTIVMDRLPLEESSDSFMYWLDDFLLWDLDQEQVRSPSLKNELDFEALLSGD